MRSSSSSAELLSASRRRSAQGRCDDTGDAGGARERASEAANPRREKAVPLIGPARCFERECKHLTGLIDVAPMEPGSIVDGAHGWACPAFPNGILDDIAYGGNLHVEPDPRQAPGTDDIVFEPYEE